MILLVATLIFIAGLCDGFIETLRHHYSAFKAIFPKANDQFFNPAISWKNKYKNGDKAQGKRFFLSTSLLVCFTDAYHLIRQIKLEAIIIAIAFLLPYNIFLSILVLQIIESIGFKLTYK